MTRSTPRGLQPREPRPARTARGLPVRIAVALAGLALAAGAPVHAQLLAVGSQLWRQGEAGVVDAAESQDWLGYALASGDFDGDGRGDLAIGVPLEDVGPEGAEAVDAGAVTVLLGGPAGLRAAGNVLLHQDVAGAAGVAEMTDNFGYALAAGDFDGDGFDDLAVGVPLEDVDPAATDDGAVQVFYGSASGLETATDQLWSQNSPGVGDDSQSSDQFGHTLAAGDFDGDGFDDLAIGVTFEDFEDSGAGAAGRVAVLYGGTAGLSADGAQSWHQNSPGISDAVESEDYFGWALAAGDLDGDGFDDLAVGAMGEDDSAGAVHVLYGSASGLAAAGSQIWRQGAGGLAETPEANDTFGAALAVGDTNGDGYDDLAIGAPAEHLGPTGSEVPNAGVVHLLFGSFTGVDHNGNQLWHQDVGGVLGAAEAQDSFGATLAVADPNADGFGDLAIGVPIESLPSGERGGAVQVLYGTAVGLLVLGNELWHRDSPGIADQGVDNDRFAWGLAAGDFDGRGTHVDLAIGAAWDEATAGASAEGAVHVLYGYLFHDGFESGDLAGWDEAVP